MAGPSGIASYSVNPNVNATVDGGSVTWAENQPPSSVNNSVRQNLADIRLALNDLAWFSYGSGDQASGTTFLGVPYVYASATSVTVAGADVTAAHHAGRRMKFVGTATGTIYGSIVSSSYASATTTTTINLTWDSGSLANETLTGYLSQIPVTGKPVPLSSIGGSGSLSLSGPLTVTSNSANALAVGANGVTNPVLQVDASAASVASGIKITGGAAGTTVSLAAISPGGASLLLDAAGPGSIQLGSVSTGNIVFNRAMTYGGVVLNNAVTGTGNMVLSANPTITGATLTGATTITGATLSNPTITGTISGAHTVSGTVTFSVAPVFSDPAGTRTALGLGTAAVQNIGTSGANVPLLSNANTFTGGNEFSGAVGGTLNIDRAGITTGRFRLFVGDGTSGTVLEEAYICSVNSKVHFSAASLGVPDTALLDNLGNFTITHPNGAWPTLTLSQAGIGNWNLSGNTSTNNFQIGLNAAIVLSLDNIGDLTLTHPNGGYPFLSLVDTGVASWNLYGAGSDNSFNINLNATTGTGMFKLATNGQVSAYDSVNTIQSNLLYATRNLSDVGNFYTAWNNLFANNYYSNASFGTPSLSASYNGGHGLGVVPRAWGWGIRCLTAENGWQVGDYVTATTASANSQGVACWVSASLIGITLGSNGIALPPKGGGAPSPITPANWVIFLWCFR